MSSPNQRHNGQPSRTPDASESFAETRRALDAWRHPEADDDLDALGSRLAAAASAPRRRRPSSALVGVVAAAAAFVVMVVLGARVERTGDRVAVSLALPWLGASEAEEADVLARRAEAVARHTTTVALAGFLETQAEGERVRRADDEERLARLVAAIDGALARERAHTARLVGALRLGASKADLRTREAVAELAAYVHEESR